MRFESLCNKTNHRIIDPRVVELIWKVFLCGGCKTDPKILLLSSHQEVEFIFPPTDSRLSDYSHDKIICKWCFNFLSLGLLAHGTQPSCPCGEELMPLFLWAPRWHVSEPLWTCNPFIPDWAYKADAVCNRDWLCLLSTYPCYRFVGKSFVVISRH